MIEVSSIWEAHCVWCGEPHTVQIGEEHSDEDRIGLQCCTCGRPGVIAWELRERRRKTRPNREKRIF